MAIDVSQVALYLSTLEGILNLIHGGTTPGKATTADGIVTLVPPQYANVVPNILSLIQDIHGKSPEQVAVDAAALVTTLEADHILPDNHFISDAVAAVSTFEATKSDFLTGQFAVVGHAEIFGLDGIIGVVAHGGPAANALGLS